MATAGAHLSQIQVAHADAHFIQLRLVLRRALLLLLLCHVIYKHEKQF